MFIDTAGEYTWRDAKVNEPLRAQDGNVKFDEDFLRVARSNAALLLAAALGLLDGPALRAKFRRVRHQLYSWHKHTRLTEIA
jgi:hypothetical protein